MHVPDKQNRLESAVLQAYTPTVFRGGASDIRCVATLLAAYMLCSAQATLPLHPFSTPQKHEPGTMTYALRTTGLIAPIHVRHCSMHMASQGRNLSICSAASAR